jgi:hypothetical protein
MKVTLGKIGIIKEIYSDDDLKIEVGGCNLLLIRYASNIKCVMKTHITQIK